MDYLTSVDEINRIFLDVDESLEKEGLSTKKNYSYYNSTTIGGSLSSDSETNNVFLETRDEDTMVAQHAHHVDTVSHNTIGLHLEAILEIDRDDLHADVTSSPIVM